MDNQFQKNSPAQMEEPHGPDRPGEQEAANRSIATLFFRNRHLLALAVIVILVGGFSAFQSLPRTEDPVITNRFPIIFTFFPGASADRVEALVTEKIEVELKEIAEIKILDTTSRAGVSVVSVELEDAVTEDSNDRIFSEIRDKLDEAALEFPPEVQDPIFDDKRGAVAFTLIVGLSWEDGREDQVNVLGRLAEDLADRLRAVPGTELVRLYGEPEEEILVTLKQDELAALGMRPEDVAAALRRADAKVPSGTLRSDQSSILLEVEGELDSTARVRNVPVSQNEGGQTIRLGDIAEVERSIRQPPAEIGLSDTIRTVYVAARVRPAARVDLWTEASKKELSAFQASLGEGIDADIVFEQNAYTSERLGQLSWNLLLGAGVVFLVVFFSMGWRASLIVGSALPLVAAFVLFVVAMQGGKLHQMSIFGMIIALGLLIDNAIVVTDEIRKHLKEGASPLIAVHRSLNHLFIPLLSSTLTTIFAFMPILLLPGNAGDFVGSIGGSVVVALSCSFLVAMTIIAALCGIFGKSGKFEQRMPAWLRGGVNHRGISRFFASAVLSAVRRPFLGMASIASLSVLGFAMASTLGNQFFPRTDRDMYQIRLWLPPESSVVQTREVVEAVDAMLRTVDGVKETHWLAGGSFPSVYYNLVMNKDNTPNFAQAAIKATDFETVNAMVDEVQATLDDSFPGAQIVVQKFAQGPPAEADIMIRISGPSISTLQRLGEEVRVILGEHPGVLHTQATMPPGEPKLWFDGDEEAARLAGLRLTEVAAQLESGLEGTVGGSMLEDLEELPVRLRLDDEERNDVRDLLALKLIGESTQPDLNAASEWVPLSALGDFTLRPEVSTITRRNSVRTNTIQGFSKPGELPIEISTQVLEELDRRGFELPAGYKLELGGDAENQGDAVGNLLLYVPVLGVLTVTILVLSFRSVRMAIILLSVGLLSVGFGLMATWMMQLPLSFNTIIGSMGLMGLAFNDNIVVLAAIRANPKARAGDLQAIANAVLSCGRHLASTTFTTIGSFLPLLIFVGGQFWPPLAIVLAGGVGGSTLLALFFTPAAYRLLMVGRKAKENPQPSPAAVTGNASPQLA